MTVGEGLTRALSAGALRRPSLHGATRQYARTPSVPSGHIGVYADAGEAGEGVLQQGQIKTYPPPFKPPIT